MAKFFGAVGFGDSVMKRPGVWEDVVVEQELYGDVVRNSRSLRDGEGANDDITVNNSISVVADEYANNHFHAIRYVRWAGALWKVTEVEVQRPRLILRLGGVYNGPTANPGTPDGDPGE